MSTGTAEVSAGQACRALEESIGLRWPRYGQVRVLYSTVEISALKTVTSRTTPSRLVFASSVLASVRGRGLPPYLPLIYSDDSDQNRIAFGPLVEKYRGRFFLIDGVHRSLAAYHAGIHSIYAAVIEPENSPPPPGPIHDLLGIVTLNTGIPRLPPFAGRASAYFRPSALFAQDAESRLFRHDI